MKDEKIKGLPIKWINTPMSYARMTTKYNLFQQSVLLKVSEFLQRYIEEYYGSDLSKSKDIPRSLFTEEQKMMGLGKFYVSYAELGVSAHSFPKVREEARQCLEKMVVSGPLIMKNGKPSQSFYPVFTEVHVDQDNATCSFEFNTKIIDEVHKLSVLDFTFDMSRKYVKHPDNIAIIGKVEKMPGLYFLLRDTMQSWKYKKAKLTVTEIKEFLNMTERDENGILIKNMYPKFSQFKKHVLEPALADIRRLKDMGQIDECFNMEFVYNSRRAVGDPAFIIFSIAKEEKTVKAEKAETEASPSGNTWEDIYFRNEALKRNPSQVACQEAWNECVQLIGDPQQREAMASVRVQTVENKRLILTGTKQQCANADNVLVTWGREKSLKFLSVVSEKAQILIESIGYYQMTDPVQTTIPFD